MANFIQYFTQIESGPLIFIAFHWGCFYMSGIVFLNWITFFHGSGSKYIELLQFIVLVSVGIPILFYTNI